MCVYIVKCVCVCVEIVMNGSCVCVDNRLVCVMCVCVLQMRSWSVEDLRVRLASLDPQMEQEIEEIRQRYQAKRRPILDAIEAKKRRQQNF